MSDGIAQHIVMAVALFCFAAACANLLCLALRGKKQPQAASGRFSAFCVLLSIAIALYTLLVFFRKDVFWFSALVADARHIAFAAPWLVAGLLVGVCWKLFAPVLALLYAAASIGCVFLLQGAYGKQSHEYLLSLDDGALVIDGVSFARDSAKFQTIVFSVERISDLVLLPVPRAWYRLRQLDEDDAGYFYDGYYAGNVFLGDDAAAAPAAAATTDAAWRARLLSLRQKALTALTGDALSLYVPVPKDVLLPALFRLRFVRRSGDLDYQLVRDL